MAAPHAPLSLRVFAPAKVNLSLEVLGRREDGYHSLRTVMATLRLADTLELTPRPEVRASEPGGVRLTAVTGRFAAGVPVDGTNLVVRALRRLAELAPDAPGIDVRLHKRVPSQAGLGGGSSDAAAALVAANVIWRTELGVCELSTLAAEIGSDASFFVHAVSKQREHDGAGGRPTGEEIDRKRIRVKAAECTGRGERVRPLVSTAMAPCVLFRPPWGLSTALVYGAVTACGYDSAIEASRPSGGAASGGGDSAGVARALERGDWRGLGRVVGNALTAAAARIDSRVAEVSERLREAPGLSELTWQMSGSGSAFFGWGVSQGVVRRAAARLRATRQGEVLLTTIG